MQNNALSAKENQDSVHGLNASLPIPDLLTSDELATVIADMYTITGSRIGSVLVEANIVLTITGGRAQTEFFIDNPTSEDETAIERLKTALEHKGFRLEYHREGSPRPEKPPYLMVNLESVRGYERVSRSTSIPGIIPYDASSGFEGIDNWRKIVTERMAEEQSKGNIPYPKEELYDILTGIVKGYPDQAIYDATEWWGLNDRQTPITDSAIKYVSKYGGATPDFMFHPDHADDPSIVQTVELWGNILEKFYNQPWHLEISKDADFLSARARI